jgi:Calpain large subunit, domain III
MPGEDFVTQFGELCVCRILSFSGAPLACVLGELSWRSKEYKGIWDTNGRRASSVGSGRSTPTQNLLTNPQYVLDIPSAKGSSVNVQLIQWPNSTMESQEYSPLGFTIYKVFFSKKVNQTRELKINLNFRLKIIESTGCIL